MSTDAAVPDYVAVNRAHWDRHAPEWVEAGERAWRSDPFWGIWAVSNDALPLLPGDMAGLSAIELGCGTGYGSAWMSRRGAGVVGVDPSHRQLATARRLAREHGLAIRLVGGIAESIPFASGTFDFALSEYGAAIWADPFRWVPEAHRILRRGGHLSFLGTGSWSDVFTPRTLDGVTGDTVHRPYFGQHRIEWVGLDDDPSIEFNLPVSAWFRLFAEVGFVVEDFFEVQAPSDATGVRFSRDAGWAKRFPSEQAWRLRKG